MRLKSSYRTKPQKSWLPLSKARIQRPKRSLGAPGPFVWFFLKIAFMGRLSESRPSLLTSDEGTSSRISTSKTCRISGGCSTPSLVGMGTPTWSSLRLWITGSIVDGFLVRATRESEMEYSPMCSGRGVSLHRGAGLAGGCDGDCTPTAKPTREGYDAAHAQS